MYTYACVYEFVREKQPAFNCLLLPVNTDSNVNLQLSVLSLSLVFLSYGDIEESGQGEGDTHITTIT